MVFSQNYDLISLSYFAVEFLQLYPSALKKLLQGLDPNLRGYQAALALYKKEEGPQPEKVCHFGFFFLSTCSQKNLE